ncbi:MAG: DUF1294 domain-containing protein [Christensenellales bacterium]
MAGILLRAVALFMLLMSATLFTLMGTDKKRAQRGAWRVSERALLLVALLFGAVGGALGMRVFRHKTKHRAFRILFPALSVLQAALLVLLLYLSIDM